MKRLLLAVTAAGLLFAGLAPSVHAGTEDVSAKIIGGTPLTSTETVPWQVALLLGNSVCGGTLIRDNWVLTAAHCAVGKSASQVYAKVGSAYYGSPPTGYQQAAELKVHPQYSASTDENDIALIRLSTPVTLSSTVQTATLPTALDDSIWPSTNPATTGVISGWGAIAEGGGAQNQLSSAIINVQTPPGAGLPCGDYVHSTLTYVNSTMLCAGNPPTTDTCQGDSGGPFVIKTNGVNYIAGVTSTGVGCARTGYPGIYTRVTAYVDWILANVGETTAPGPPTGVSASAGNASATVTWNVPSVTGGIGITSYRVLASPGPGECRTSGETRTCDIGALQPGVTYTFTVTATNAVGTGPASQPSAGVVPYAAPGQVTNVVVRAKTTKLDVSWDAPAANGDAALTYTLETTPDAGECVASSATSCMLSGLDANAMYKIVITASNKAGSGEPSVPAFGVPLSVMKKKGDVVSFKKLKQYSGLKIKSGAKVSYAVPKASSGYCKMVSNGSKMTKKSSTCKVGVRVKNPNKQAKTQVVFIGIT